MRRIITEREEVFSLSLSSLVIFRELRTFASFQRQSICNCQKNIAAVMQMSQYANMQESTPNYIYYKIVIESILYVNDL